MSVLQINNFWSMFFLGVMLICLTACGTQGNDAKYLDMLNINYSDTEEQDQSKAWPDKDLQERFAKYWHLKFSGQHEDLFGMEAPHFQFLAKQGVYESYISRSKGELKQVEIQQIKKISDYKYQINCKFSFSRANQEREVAIADRWVEVDDDWFHVIKDQVVFPFTAN